MRTLVTGRVTDDSQKPVGIAGVAVTDGSNLTHTDARGVYQLAIDTQRRRTQMVYITVPTGWQAPLDKSCTPTFFRRVNLTGERPTTGVDFVLSPDPSSLRERYYFVALADVHVQAGGANTRVGFSRQLREIGSISREVKAPAGSPAFVAVAGDLTNDATPGEFRDYLAATAEAKVPVWSVPGNHDLAYREPGGPHPKEFSDIPYHDLVEPYRKAVGPEWYSFQYGPHHFVVLENYRGLVESDQLNWLEKDLSLHGADHRVVVVAHVPWNVPPTPDRSITDPYFALFRDYDVQLLLAGHTHSNDVSSGLMGDVRQVVTTSPASPLDGTPRGFRFVEIDPNNVRSPYYELDAHRRPTIVHPTGAVRRSQSIVRVSRYSPPGIETAAQFRIDDQPWQSLEPVGRRMWTAPAELGAKGVAHEIRVRVRDDSGADWDEVRTEFSVGCEMASAPRLGKPWAMNRRDAKHTGLSPDSVKPPLALAWVSHTGGTLLSSSPALADNTVYIGVRDEDDHRQNGVTAFDLPSGAQRWFVPTSGPVEGSVAVADGVVVAAAVRGPLLGLDAATGEVRWSWKPESCPCWMYFSPTIVDETVYQAYCRPEGVQVAMLNLHSGKVNLETAEAVGRNWISRGSPAVSGDRLYFTTAYGNLVAASASTGELIWQTLLNSPLAMRSAPVVAGESVLQACDGDRLVALDADRGVERWSYRAQDKALLPGVGTAAGPAVADDVVYAAFTDGSVVALRLDTGKELWRHQTAGPVLSSPTVSGDALFVGSHDGLLRALDRDNGECLWSHDLGCWVATSPAVSGNAVVIGAWDGHVYVFTGF